MFQVLHVAFLPPLGLALFISSRVDLHSIWITHHAKQVQYVELQDDHFF